MNKVYDNMLDLVGKTPLVKIHRFVKNNNISNNIYAKMEYFNPMSSVKDRIALNMISDAEEKGLINKDTTIIEPTSGNTGIGLSFVCATKGYKLILTMPESMSIERRKIVQSLGTELILTDASKGMKGSIEKAKELSNEIENSIVLQQFQNQANPTMHYNTTGPEIWEALDGNVDIFVAGVGTGGTISGTGKYLKEKNPNIKVIAVEPSASPVLSGGDPGPHKIQGIGAGFVPDTLNTEIYDEIIKIDNDVAISTCKEVAATDGMFVGISAGAALAGVKEIASREENKGKTIVVVFPDSGERYLSVL